MSPKRNLAVFRSVAHVDTSCISLSNASEEILLSRAKQIKQKVKQINLVLIFYLKLESAQWSRAVMGPLKTVWRVLCAASL